MSISEINSTPVPIKLWTPLEQVESSALTQLKNVAGIPWVFKHVAVMPDVHGGKGCTVGSVIAMKNAVSPAAVGVDIGCGMGALRTSLTSKDLPENLDELRDDIENTIPVGFNAHEFIPTFARVEGQKLWSRAPELLFGDISDDAISKARKQCGTLGGGNHFIELCLDEQDRVWVLLHSGSRNIGKTLAELHIDKAKGLDHNKVLKDPDMAVFLAGTPGFQSYYHDLMWAQEYAFLNRETMLHLLKCILKNAYKNVTFNELILCHHNYVAQETHFGESVYVTRKGAIRANVGDLALIPGSMGTSSYVVRGLGNPESFCSASHGAGRRMSRGAAKRAFKVEDLVAQTHGVCCRKDSGVLDEIPSAYKDIDQVMENQRDLVEIVHKLKQVLCVKG